MDDSTIIKDNRVVKLIPARSEKELEELVEYEYYEEINGQKCKVTRYALEGVCPRFDAHLEVHDSKDGTSVNKRS